jgi:hypothetical protein
MGCGALHLRVEQIAPTEEDAARSADALTALVQLFEAIQPKIEAQTETADAEAVRQFVSSVKVEQHKDRAVLTAIVPLQLLKKLTAADSAAAGGAPAADATAGVKTTGP